VTDDDRTEYYVLPEAYRTEVCAGLTPLVVTAALRDRGLLVLGGDGKSLRQERPPGLGSTKVYRIKADILGDAE
jgi:putative DNA primase/helicase